MMNDDLKQKLSSLMDGDIDNHADHTISQLLATESLRKTWWRYHLITDTLNNNLPGILDRRLAGKVAGDIANEPVQIAGYRMAISRFFKPAAGLAIAASVAAIAILGIQQNSVPAPERLPVKVADTNPAQFNANISRYTFPVSSTAVSATIADTEIDKPNPLLNSYLVNYNEARTSQTGVQGIIPYARIIANDDE